MNKSTDMLLSGVIAAAALIWSLPIFWSHIGPDLTATWMAANLLDSGQVDLVYSGEPGKDGWIAKAREIGVENYQFLHYLYPPLWVALLAPWIETITHQQFQTSISVLNHLCLLGSVVLAWRISGSRLPLALFLLLGLVAISFGPFAPLALFHNQLQIVTTFLVLLAIERARHGHHIVAGVALALACSIKVTPVLLLLPLLAVGRWKETLTGFVLAGGTLGGLSLLIAGVPLHLDFLELLSTVVSWAVVLDVSLSLDALWAQCAVIYESCLSWETGRRWPMGSAAVLKTAQWRIATTILQIAAVLMVARAIQRNHSPLVWPAGMIAITLAGPIAWSYHYLSAIVFAPLLIDRLGFAKGGALFVAFVFLTSTFVKRRVEHLPGFVFNEVALGIFAVVALATVFAWIATRPKSNNN